MKLLIIGLDGASFRFIDSLRSQGRLPTLDRLIGAGAHGSLLSTIPPITAAAWPSFFLGQNPGTHGIVDFRDTDARDYSGSTGRMVSSHSFRHQTLFDLLSGAGLKTAAIRVPMTYPPWPINGVMVAGAPTPDESRLFIEPESVSEVGKVEGEFDIGNRLLSLPVIEQVATLEAQLERTAVLTERFLGSEDFDAAMVVSHAPDNAHHAFWRFLDSHDVGRRGLIDHFYERSDAFVARMIELTSEGTLVVIVSDHGGCPRGSRVFYLDRWLAEEGFMTLKRLLGASPAQRAVRMARTQLERMPRLRQRLRRMIRSKEGSWIAKLRTDAPLVDWSKTKAYGVYLFHPYSSVEFNLRGRQREGTISSDDAEALAVVLRDRLLSFRDPDNGAQPIIDVLSREEAWGKTSAVSLPDLVIEVDPSYEVRLGSSTKITGPAPPPVEGDTSSLHGREGVLILSGPMVKKGVKIDGARIEDCLPTILYALGIPVPKDLDGVPLLNSLTESFTAGREVEISETVHTSNQTDRGLTLDEEEQIQRHLAELGYVDE